MIRINTKEIQPFEIAHAENVRSLSSECTLFLKRNGKFPLASPCDIALYGSGARGTIKGGTGSGDVNTRHFVTVEEGLNKAGFRITTTDWLDRYEESRERAKLAFYDRIREEAKAAGMTPFLYGMGKIMLDSEYDLPLNGSGEAAVYVLGRVSGEGADRTEAKGDICLTDAEIRDILALNRTYDKFMLVLNVGGLVDLTPVQEVGNILLLGQIGIAAGDTFADILLGKAYPSGKLTMTWTDLKDYPSTENFGSNDDTVYAEGIYVGYRYFDTVQKAVKYPFGFGLGYTDFDVEPKAVSVDGTRVNVTAEVTNVGRFAGREVVQVYLSAPGGKLARPYQELVGFSKTHELKSGESCEVLVSFDLADISAYDEESASYLLEAGEYAVRVGNSSRNTRIAAVLVLKETVITRKVKNICVGDRVEEWKLIAPDWSAPHAVRIPVNASAFTSERVVYSAEPEELTGEAVDWQQVVDGSATVEQFVAGLSDRAVAQLCVGGQSEQGGGDSIIGSAGISVCGAAGQSAAGMHENGFRGSLVMADGPAGVRLNRSYRIVNGKLMTADSPFGEDGMNLIEPERLAAIRAVSEDPTFQAAQEYYQHCVAIPAGTALAQSFNPEAARSCGVMVAEEMEMFGVQLWLAPALNIHRSPMCGRNFEYYSEDPLVSGMFAAAITNGVQSRRGCGTTVKHFACNNQETNRYGNNSIVSERALREIYLRGFEYCVKHAQPHCVMTSYNLVNGEHTCNSRDLVTAVLRDEWGFQGFVMTDWLITMPFLKRSRNKYGIGSAPGCVKAGNDVIMPGSELDLENIFDALNNPGDAYPITRAHLQACAARVLNRVLASLYR